tara:strand:+ start:270 stop:1847 length:1578 start_codon:yes stop_codon:yes gene_type:complete
MPHDGSRANGIKISDFPSASIDDSHQLTFIGNGINYRIPFSTFKAGLGVTGTLQQSGDVTATPILDTQATDNFIRNLEDGPGFKSSISPENGVTVEHNFTVGAVGNPLMLNPTAASPTFPSLIAGDGTAISAGVDSYTISATGAVSPSNTEVINQESDFTVQDGGTITLCAGVRYVIGASITTAKRFICEEGFVMTMENVLGPILTYTGTSAMFTSSNTGGTFVDARFDSPNASQTFAMTDTSNTKFLIVNGVRVLNTPKWGTYTGFRTVSTTFSSGANADSGLTIAGSGLFILDIRQFAIISSAANTVALDIGSSVIPNIEIDSLIIAAPSGFLISGLPNNGNVTSGSLATLINSSSAGGAGSLDGVSKDDFRWRFSGNTGIPDTHPDGKLSVSGNALETVIAATFTPVKANAVWDIGAASHFTADSTGRITYNGETEFTAPIIISTTLLMASGGDNQVAPYVAVNGVEVANTGMQMTASSTKAGTATVVWQHDFHTGDYVELVIENHTGTTNVILQQSVMLVN